MAELFEKFEVNSYPRWRFLSKLVGASLVVHLGLCGWSFTSLPCATLLTSRVDSHTKFVDKDYRATQIGDDVQIVKLEKFRYPDGYFALGAQIDGQLPAQPPAPDR